MGDAVTLSVEEGIATITLNQPEQRNPLNEAVRDDFNSILEGLSDDIRCLVIQGAGPAFSAGGDIDRMHDRIAADESPESRVLDLEPINQTITNLARYPVPTVAKVDGACVGAGIALMLACDIQLVTDRSVFGVVFCRVGLSLDAGTSYLLTQAVGSNVAKELAYTGDIFDAERALDIGLVNHVYAEETFDEDADELIERIAAGPTVAHHHTKELIDSVSTRTLEESMRAEMTAGGVVYATDDHREGVTAFREDREPEFTGR